MRTGVYVIYSDKSEVSKKELTKLSNSALRESRTPIGKVFDERFEIHHVGLHQLGTKPEEALIYKASEGDVFIVFWSKECYEEGVSENIKTELKELHQKIDTTHVIPIFIGDADIAQYGRIVLGIEDSTSDDDILSKIKAHSTYRKIVNPDSKEKWSNARADVLQAIIDLTSILLNVPKGYKTFFQERSAYLNDLLREHYGGIYLTQTSPISYSAILKKAVRHLSRSYFATLKYNWYERVFNEEAEDAVPNKQFLEALSTKAKGLGERNAWRLWIGEANQNIEDYIANKNQIDEFIHLNEHVELCYLNEERLDEYLNKYNLPLYVPDMGVFDDAVVIGSRGEFTVGSTEDDLVSDSVTSRQLDERKERRRPSAIIEIFFKQDNQKSCDLLDLLTALCYGAPNNGVLTKDQIMQRIRNT
jgi:hypothetical protein